MKDGAEAIMKDWFALLLTSLGISFSTHQFLGGLFLALAGAAIARALSPERDQRELWLVFATGAIAGIVAAEAMSVWMTGGPVQLIMGAAGFASRYLARFGIALLERAEARGTQIADRVIDKVMPDDKKDGEK